MPEEKRILALDVGQKRIGIAVSDPLEITACGIGVIERTNKREDIKKIRDIVAANQVREMIVGLPKNLDGSLGRSSDYVMSFIDSLKKQLPDLVIKTWDERFSSQGAERVLSSSGLNYKKRKEFLDKMAAQWILQGYLESIRNENIQF